MKRSETILMFALGLAASVFAYSLQRADMASVAHAQPVVRTADDTVIDLAGGTPNWSGSRTCPTGSTVFFGFDNPTDFGADDYMLFPDGSMVLINNETASSKATCCWVSDDTSAIGAQTATATENQVDSTAGGSCTKVLGGTTVPFKFKFSAWSTSTPGYNVGVCSAASPHDRSDQWNPHKICANDADCQSIAGHGSSETCVTSNLGATLGSRGRRSALLACRCSAAATVHARIKR